MKTRNIFAILALLPLVAGLTGCKSDEETTAKPAKEMLRVLGGNIEIRSNDETTVVSVYADCHWKVDELDTGDFGNHLTVQPREGIGDGTLVVTTDQNVTNANRNATFTLVSDGGLKQKVTVTQVGMGDGMNISRSSMRFETEPTEAQTLTVNSNTQWRLQVPSGVNWIHFDKTSGNSGAAVIQVTADNAVTDAERTATVSVLYGGSYDKSVEFTVSQAGMSEISLFAPEDIGRIEYQGGERMITIESNARWYAYIPSTVDWLRFEPRDSLSTAHSATGVGNGEIRIMCRENNTTRDRLTAVVIVAGTKNPKQSVVIVEQAANGSAQPLQTSVSLSQLSVSRESANFLMNIVSEEVVGDYGLVYTDGNETPTLDNGRSVVIGRGGTSTGFAYELTGLSESTTYRVRAFVRKANSDAVVYSDVVTITTTASSITVGELTSMYVGNTSAEFRYSFVSDSEVIDYGLVYSTTETTPTRDNADVLTVGQGGTSRSVLATLANLQQSTTYHVRAYVLTQSGFVYSNTVNITTSSSTHEPGESDNPDPQLAPRK